MRCTNCGQASDWTGRASDWTPVHDHVRTVRVLYRCEQCGHQQLNR